MRLTSELREAIANLADAGRNVDDSLLGAAGWAYLKMISPENVSLLIARIEGLEMALAEIAASGDYSLDRIRGIAFDALASQSDER